MPKKKAPARWSTAVYVLIGISLSIVALLLFPLLLPDYRYDGGFSSLAQMKEYAQNHDEMLPLENDNLYRPDFTNHYKSYRAHTYWSGLRWLTTAIGITAHDAWNIFTADRLVTDVSALDNKKTFNKRFIYKMAPKVDTNFIIIGDLLGAFHSLVRTLDDLKKREIIGNNLALRDKNSYIIIMGDAISRSAYGLETLSVLLALIKANPDQVVYLRGNHEDNKYWHAFGMKNQIEAILAEEGAETAKELIKKIDMLFQKLPEGLFMRLPASKNQFVQFSHLSNKSNRYLEEKYVADFLLAPQKEAIDGYQISRKRTSKKDIDLEAVFRSEKKRDSFQVSRGLRTLHSNEGAITWTLFSSPSLVNQQGLNFKHDAYAELIVGAHQVNWSIALHYRNASGKADDFSSQTYEFFTGKKNESSAIKNLRPMITLQKKKTKPKAHPIPENTEDNALDNFEDDLDVDDVISLYEDMSVLSSEENDESSSVEKKGHHGDSDSLLIVEEMASDNEISLTMELSHPSIEKKDPSNNNELLKDFSGAIESIPKEAFITKINDDTKLIFVPVMPIVVSEKKTESRK